MLLKQNCFVISETEQHYLEDNTYIKPKTAFSGSSLSRKHNKVNETVTKLLSGSEINENKCNLSEFAKNWKREIEEKRAKRKPKAENIPHTLSQKSKTKIRNKLIAWANAVPKNQSIKFTFTTLTLTSAQTGSDKDFTRMLNTLFTYLRKYDTNYGFKRYLYVLEKQKNGNTHAHLVASQFMPNIINKIWCKILSDNGYTFPQINYITGEVRTITPLESIRNYAKAGVYSPANCKYGAYSNCDKTSKYYQKVFYPKKVLNVASPVDFSVVKNLKDISKYITKYITKNETAIKTNVWNCSKWVSELWTGANICAETHFLALKRFTVGEQKIVLADGYTYTIYLLKYYTQLQKEIFSQVNNYH